MEAAPWRGPLEALCAFIYEVHPLASPSGGEAPCARRMLRDWWGGLSAAERRRALRCDDAEVASQAKLHARCVR